MTRRSRIVGFGSAALLVVVGGVCAVVLSGLASDLALGVMGLGIVLAVSLVFLEVGFSEDRERAREEAARAREAERQHKPGEEPGRRPRRTGLQRRRGRPRRLS
jgi:hypothetical protein